MNEEAHLQVRLRGHECRGAPSGAPEEENVVPVATAKWTTWLPVVAASAAAAYAFTKRQGHRSSIRGTGVLADRGSDTRRRLGGRAGIHVEQAVTVYRPVAEVFRFWRDFDNLPTFMNHLQAVSQREGGISHWVARGPAGTTVEWDARIINEIDNKLIAWQSLEGSMISTAGSVTFRDTPRGTEVRVHLQYNPPGGRVGAAFAWLFGEEPSAQIREDLRRFKQLIETGEIPTVSGQPVGGRR
jgi:uncharacterized membrane protein